MGIVNAAVIDGDAVVAGRAEGFHRGLHFFKRATQRFLALIHAEEDLRRGPALHFEEAAVLAMAGKAAQDDALVTPFVGLMKDAAALQAIAGAYLAGEGLPLVIAQAGDLIRR